MRIFTWSDPNYFKYLTALVKSIRHSGNKYDIILHLMDFNEKQKAKAMKTFENDSKITFLWSNHKDSVVKVTNTFEYYRNSRTKYFLKLLEEDERDLLTFGANGLVFADLKYIEDILKENDFCFLERQKQIVQKVKTNKTHVRNINELSEHVKTHNLDINSVLDQTTGKVVLLGTHGIQNNHKTRMVLRRWIELVDNPKYLNRP